MKFFILFSILIISKAGALEIDEKLTLRIIDTSESKKTVLINRGLEDGLAQNDHAKFYVSTGVVARGVCIKVSPTRSVWSVYRLVNGEFIRNEQVMKLKITPAVKITNDESRMLVEDNAKSNVAKDPRDLGIPLADGADDLTFEQNKIGRDAMDSFENTSLLKKNKEIVGMFSYAGVTDKTSPDNNLEDYSSDVTSFLMRAGGEWYFEREKEWYTRFSFAVTFTYEKNSLQAYQGVSITESNYEFGFGANFFPFKRPSEIHELIHYLNYTFTLGSSSSSFTTGSERGVVAVSSDTVDGAILANSFGYGLRYYTVEGYGARIEVNYLLRGDTFAGDSNGTQWVKTKIGPRVLVGLSKRF